MIRKTLSRIGLCALALLPVAALADEATGGGLKLLGVAVGVGLAGAGAAAGIGMLGGRLLEGIARQPELEPRLMRNFFVTAGLTDAVPIIAIAVALLILFVF